MYLIYETLWPLLLFKKMYDVISKKQKDKSRGLSLFQQYVVNFQKLSETR